MELLQHMKAEKAGDLKWRDGKSFCLIYYPGEEKASLIQEAYNMFFTENALNPMSFPSLRKFEAEVVSMTADLFHGSDDTCGTLTSGGTESILMAVKTARDYSRVHKPEISRPEIILPSTAHPAFDKACHYFDVQAVHVPVDHEYRADIKTMREKISERTIMLVGSAPSYPHGVIDPVRELSDMALHHNLLLHVDACIGGFMLPFMKQLGYYVPEYDFTLPGVTSISADLHKYGYAAKGASVILYKTADLRKLQFFVSTEWPGGVYGSSSVAGSRPGGAIAAAWAALMSIGEDGYLELARTTMEVTDKIRKGIEAIPGLYLMGKPDMSILAFTSDTMNVYELADELNNAGWHFERLQDPAGLHLTINYIHKNAADAFLEDLRKAAGKVQKLKVRSFSSSMKLKMLRRLVKVLPKGSIAAMQRLFSGRSAPKMKRTAPLYGMMGVLAGTRDLNQIMLDLLDKLNRLE